MKSHQRIGIGRVLVIVVLLAAGLLWWYSTSSGTEDDRLDGDGQTAARNSEVAASGFVDLQVSGLKANVGQLQVALFDNGVNFPSQAAALRKLSLDINGSQANARIADLDFGTYAIALFQDLNGDGFLNKGAFGVPVEPFAFSNNARGRFGPPAFADAAIVVDGGGATVTLDLGQ